MENLFITKIKINNVRHLKGFEIELSRQEARHLIITGKNGSGKTSLLNSLATFINSITNSNDPMEAMRCLETDKNNLLYYESQDDKQKNNIEIRKIKERIANYENRIDNSTGGVMLELNVSLDDVKQDFKQGHFVVAYYQADRVFKAQLPQHVEKVALRNDYTIRETPREDFIKYLLDLKMTQALADSNGKKEKAKNIKLWFDNFQELLKTIFEDDSVKLEFDEDTFKFQIVMDGREAFDFNTLSSGYAAILDIVVDLIIRMEKQTNKVFDFSMPGIVLIDEIETHLHLALQGKILELLTTIFPKVQFIVSTHSPFIVNSLENATIFDLEKHLLVKGGLADVPYAGIVEGYFNADSMSRILREKYEKYKKLVGKSFLTDDDFEEISDLEMYLDEIPDYLALNITIEYQRLKMELRNRD
ncbi:MAG: AAA family ATPase, partial [Floccifex sp.]